MPSQVNRVPQGFLSLLGIQALGQNPRILPDELQATLDLTPFYVRGYNQPVGANSAALATVGPSLLVQPLFDVPAGELMLVTSVVARTSAVLAAGAAIKFAPCVLNMTNGIEVELLGEIATGAPGEIPYSGSSKLVVVPPGFTIGVAVQSLTGAGIAVNVWATVQRVKF